MFNFTIYKQYSNKGLKGLANLGNTCFINSCLQILSHTYELNEFFRTKFATTKLNNKADSLLLISWNRLLGQLWDTSEPEGTVVVPDDFLNCLQRVSAHKKKDIFTGYAQNDVSEFLIFLLECFHNGLAREVEMKMSGNVLSNNDKIAEKCYQTIINMYAKDYSEIWKMFYGMHISKTVSLETKEIMCITPEPYFILDLPIPSSNKSPTLLDCFDLYVEGEILDGDNAVFNETTRQKEAVQKQLEFWSFPDILVITLKRYTMQLRKNQVLVTFPLEGLDLTDYSYKYENKRYVYDLYGVCNHSGSVLGGHYTAFVKNANSKWYLFNDTSVSEVGMESQIITPKAYCFFYRRRQT